MEFVEPEDGPPFRRPPSLDDRLWRHPSEVGSSGTRSPAVRTLWVVAALSALGASILTTTAVVTLSTLTDGGEAATVPSAPVSVVTPTTEVEPVVAIAERVRPTIVQLQVRRGLSGGANGSGVMFRADGHVLTNAHVVDGATALKIVLANGRELVGTLVGADADSDIAVVKVDGGPFPAASLGTASSLKVGQRAIAIGSPLALAGGPSVTVGVVSALHRTVRTRSNQQLFDMIQTDAPISPGSSGGALLDASGEVIGITTAIAVSDTGPEGLGFATTIDLARANAEQLIATGKVSQAWLGIEGNDLDGATAHDLKLNGGALVTGVREESPAQQAGLLARDVIVSVNGKTITSMGMLVVALRMQQPGDGVVLEIVREGQRHTMSATLSERPPNP
jgi:S1-C subfamily serine protease